MPGSPTDISKPAISRATIVRYATLDDLEVLIDLSCQLCVETEGRTLEREIVRQGLNRVLNSPPWFILVAECESRVAGELIVGGAEWSEWSNGLYWWVTSLYADPAFRGAGIIRLLFDRLHELARSSPDGVIGIRGASKATNKAAHAALAKVGKTYNGYIIIDGLL